MFQEPKSYWHKFDRPDVWKSFQTSTGFLMTTIHFCDYDAVAVEVSVRDGWDRKVFVDGKPAIVREGIFQIGSIVPDQLRSVLNKVAVKLNEVGVSADDCSSFLWWVYRECHLNPPIAVDLSIPVPAEWLKQTESVEK